MTRHCLPLALGLLLFAPLLAAQAPAPLSGDRPSLAVRSQVPRTNRFLFTVRGGTIVDDNALQSRDNRVTDITYLIEAGIAFDQQRPRLQWSLNYSPGFALNQRLADRDLITHAFGLYLQGQTTRRSSLRLRTNFFLTSNPFGRLDQAGVPEFGNLERPNESVITPIARRIGGLAGLDYTYQLGPRSVFGLSAAYADVRFRDLPATDRAGQRLIDSRVAAGRVFTGHQVTRRQNMGFSYGIQNMIFRLGQARAVVHTVLYSHSFSFTPNSTWSFYAGPEYTRAHDQIVLNIGSFPLVARLDLPVFNAFWGVTAGSSYGWQGERTSLRFSLLRRISDGGGLLGAVRLHQGDANLLRRLGRLWTASLAFAYGDSRALNASDAAALRGLSAGAGLSCILRENLSLNFSYAWVQQDFQGVLIGDGRRHSNRGQVSLAYQFERALGR